MFTQNKNIKIIQIITQSTMFKIIDETFIQT